MKLIECIHRCSLLSLLILFFGLVTGVNVSVSFAQQSLLSDIDLEFTNNYAVDEPANNSVRFAQVPNRPKYFVGREQVNGSGWKAILCTFDYSTRSFKSVKDLLPIGVQIADNYKIQSVYDPSVMVYKGEVWVAFECGLEEISGKAEPLTLVSRSKKYNDVCIIMGVLDTEKWRFDPSRISIPVAGYGDEGGLYKSSSVPKLLVYKDIPYLYYTIMERTEDGVRDVQRLYSRGVRLKLENTGRGRLWADVDVQGPEKTIRCDDSRTSIVFDTDLSRDIYTCDLFDVKVANGKIIASAGMGLGPDSDNPLMKVENCYFPVFSETVEPLAYNTFGNSIVNDRLRTNPCEYPTFVKNTQDGSTSLFVMFTHPDGYPFSRGLRVFENINPELNLEYNQKVNPSERYFNTVSSIGRENILPSESKLISPNKKYMLTMQDDGNLVLYKLDDNGSIADALWNSNTEGNPGSYLVFQYDSNIVIYSPDNVPLWESDTNTFGGVSARIQDDGNFEMYNKYDQLLWTTNAIDTP